MSAIPQHGPSILLREDRGGVCTLTMNRPLQMNLLTTEMLEALQKAFDSLMDDAAGGCQLLAQCDLAVASAAESSPRPA
jgi:enoyl-CoA hydratase/carnithine racemase